MDVIEVPKEEMYQSLRETYENTNKQGKEMNKTVQDLKVEIESAKKTLPHGYLKRKIGHQTVASEKNLTNRIQKLEEKISSIEDMIEERNILVKENFKCLNSGRKDSGHLGHQEKTKSM